MALLHVTPICVTLKAYTLKNGKWLCKYMNPRDIIFWSLLTEILEVLKISAVLPKIKCLENKREWIRAVLKMKLLKLLL